jgi:cob(I)alamin adenosyltransferase
MPKPRPRTLHSIATRKGDDGTTSLLYGQRVRKDHPRIETVGSLDELNAALGFAKATTPRRKMKRDLARIQQELVALMGEVACAPKDAKRHAASKFVRIDATAVGRLDDGIAAIEARRPRFDGWATPGANLHSAALELARTTARRAERRLVGLAGPVRPLLLQYINRLSDLLWLMAREAEM